MQNNKSNSGFNKIERWVRFIRDVVLLLGILVLIVVAINLHKLQKDILKKEKEALKVNIKLLNQAQYTEGFKQVKALKNLLSIEKGGMKEAIKKLSEDIKEVLAELGEDKDNASREIQKYLTILQAMGAFIGASPQEREEFIKYWSSKANAE